MIGDYLVEYLVLLPWGNREVGRWGSGEVGKWGSGEVGKWGSGEVVSSPYHPITLSPASCPLTTNG
ncbi:MAG: hypothetical protein IM337_03085 [Microcystis sp. M110S1]|uniref:hypothetical protein n=1 Tax=Microcystis sp. M110S1 TaxID=2771102 RepID=UPI00258B0AA4|nr:hypothetical protein [Microcystis sp. M110S1]MCA2973040.1 hypothetical protein [Microcystis sp. M110S1]